MWGFFADLLFDALVPYRWRNDDGEVCTRWYILGLLLAIVVIGGLVFGALYLLGVH